MKKHHLFFLLTFLFLIPELVQGQLQPFNDNVELQPDFSQDNLVGWTSVDEDGFNTASPSFQDFPGKGDPLGFIVYNTNETDPVNELEFFGAHSGSKYFVSISSWDGPVNDWLITDELDAHPGGTFSFYAKSSATFAGDDQFKVAYSTSGSNTTDFTFFNDGNTTIPTGNWVLYEYEIPAGAKHVAINCVSEAVMFMVDDIKFEANVVESAPGAITDYSVEIELGAEIEANFSWVNPTVDNGGNALANMTGVKVYRGTHPMNLTEIADLPSEAGESMLYTDNLPEGGFYIHRFVPYNSAGNGDMYTTPLNFFGYETIPGAPANVEFTQDGSGNTVISWDEVDYGSLGGSLENPVVGYTVIRSLGSTSDTLVQMNAPTSFTETEIPTLNLYTYSILAQTSTDDFGIPTELPAYSGLAANQVSVTSGNEPADQPFELSRNTIISQSIYTPEEIGETGLITSLSYFANLGATSSAHYKIYMSTTENEVFGTSTSNAVWEYFGDQELLFDGTIEFPMGQNAITIDLDQPFFYDAATGANIIITLVKPLLENPPSVNPRKFYNTEVDGMRTYYALGYTVDFSLISTQPASWSTYEVTTIPSIVMGKSLDYGTLSGTVTALGDGTLLEGVSVSIVPADSEGSQTASALTDDQGVYSVAALLPGDYVATFTFDNYNTQEITFTIEANEEVTLDAALDNALPIEITGTVVDGSGTGIEGVNLSLTGYSAFATVTDVDGNYTLEAFAEKAYDLSAQHPLYITQSMSITSEESDYTLDPIVMELALHKPGSVTAVNNNGVGDVNWSIPPAYFNETVIGWGSFATAGDAWGNGNDPFVAGIRLTTADLVDQVPENGLLTHVRAYIANNAEININVYKGDNGAELIHSQPASIGVEGWYLFELSEPLTIDFDSELWIGVEFLAGQSGSYPIGLDDGPNAPAYKGSMKYENGVWTQMSLTNKNWNVYGVVNNAIDAEPSGYRVYRSEASATNWSELTTDPITETSFSDAALASQDPGAYEYGIAAIYGETLESIKGISNEINLNMFWDFTLEIATDFGTPEGAYVSMWNGDSFAEAFVASGESTVTFSDLLFGDYNLRVELDNFEIAEQSNVEVSSSETVTVPLSLLKVQPSNLTATPDENSSAVTLDWTLHEAFTDQFEKYADFERENIGNYILNDVDGNSTYTYTNFSYPDAGAPMSFMVFNPYSTIPEVSTINAFSGRRFLAAFAGPDGVSNDWLIIPAGSGAFSFQAASLLDSPQETIQVMYSTTGSNVADFTAFEGEISVPQAWTQYSFDAPAGTKYVAINYIGDDTYFVKIDDVTFEKEYNHALSYNVYLDGELIADNVLETTYTIDDLADGSHLAEVEAVYETGVSVKTEITLGTVGLENANEEEFGVYPNPTTGLFTLELESKATVHIFDLSGRKIYTGVQNAGKTDMSQSLPAGTYIIQVETEKGTFTKRLVFM